MGASPSSRKGAAMAPPADRSSLDFADPEAVRGWIVDLRVACDDLDSVLADALKPERRRRLGHKEWKRLRREARDTIASLLRYAGAPEPDDDGGAADPAGQPHH